MEVEVQYSIQYMYTAYIYNIYIYIYAVYMPKGTTRKEMVETRSYSKNFFMVKFSEFLGSPTCVCVCVYTHTRGLTINFANSSR